MESSNTTNHLRPRPSNPFDCIPPHDLFAADVKPECYPCWRDDRYRDLILWCVNNHGLTIVEAVEELWEAGGL
jgi:hypothetical protein